MPTSYVQAENNLEILIAFCGFEVSFNRADEIEASEVEGKHRKSYTAMIKSKPIVTSNKQFAL